MAEQMNIKLDVALDLGNKGCGDLAISHMITMKTVEGGQVLEVHRAGYGSAKRYTCLVQDDEESGPCGEGNAFYYIKKKIQ